MMMWVKQLRHILPQNYPSLPHNYRSLTHIDTHTASQITTQNSNIKHNTYILH